MSYPQLNEVIEEIKSTNYDEYNFAVCARTHEAEEIVLASLERIEKETGLIIESVDIRAELFSYQSLSYGCANLEQMARGLFSNEQEYVVGILIKSSKS